MKKELKINKQDTSSTPVKIDNKCVKSIRLTPFICMKLSELSISHSTNVSTVIRGLLLYAINEITDNDGYEKQM